MTSINVEKIRARDEQALGEVFNELMPTLRRVARRFQADLVDPDDVVGDVVVQLLRDTDRLADLVASGKLRTYCVSLTRNAGRHHAHRIMRAQRAAAEFDELVSGLEAREGYGNLELQEMQDRLQAAIARLGSSERALIEMLYLRNKSLDEIAQDLGVSSTAVRVKLVRARQHLWRLMSSARGAGK